MYSRLSALCSSNLSARSSDYKFFIPEYDEKYLILPSNNLMKDQNQKDQMCQTCAPNAVGENWEKDPTRWGPHLWAYLHYAALNYPTKPTREQSKEMEDWLKCLPITIPCSNCSEHYRAYIAKHTAELSQICATKNALFQFLVDIHNQVNRRNGKPEMSYEDALKIYSSRSR